MKTMRKIRLAISRFIAGSEIDGVTSFQKKFGILCNDDPSHVTKRKLNERIQFLQEELDEFREAADVQDLPGMADALIDLVYVAKGTAISMGLPWDELWDDVHRANMSKVPGPTKRGHRVDATKPRGWVGPQTTSILKLSGYDRNNFTFITDGEIAEELCDDDK